MSEEIQDIKLGEAYLQGTLDDQQRKSVELRLESDSSFAQLLKDLRIMLEGTRAAILKEVESQLQQVEEGLSPIQIDEVGLTLQDIPEKIFIGKRAKKFNLRIIAIASSFLLILSLAIFSLKPSAPKQLSEQLFDKHFQAYPSVGTLRSEAESKIASALEKYQFGQYEDAIDLFNAASENENIPLYLLYIGICYLNTDPAKSAPYFDAILEVEDLKGEGLWYTALRAVRLGDFEEAKRILNTLDYPKRNEAVKKLLEDLENL